MVREFGQESVDELSLHLLVRLSQQVNVACLFHHLLLARISTRDYLKIRTTEEEEYEGDSHSQLWHGQRAVAVPSGSAAAYVRINPICRAEY